MTSADGVRLHFEVVGDGPPLVFHAGAGCDASLWQEAGYVEALAPSYTCVLFDHRGHGLSDRPRGWNANTVDHYVDDLLALIDQADLGAVGFWGYSSAIDVGLKLSQDHPDRVRALIGSGAVGPSTPADDAEWAEQLAVTLKDKGWEHLLAGFDRQDSQRVPDWMKDRIRATDLQQFIDWLEATKHAQWHYWAALPEVRTPTLFVVGELEDPDDETALAVAQMPDAQRHIVVGGGHIRAFLDTEAVLRAVAPFLGQHL